VEPGGLEPLPIRTRFTVSLPYPNDFQFPIFVPRDRIELSPFACKTNTLPLRQRGWWMDYFFRVEFANLKTTLYPRRVMILLPIIKSDVLHLKASRAICRDGEGRTLRLLLPMQASHPETTSRYNVF
jgi:hypothetical protein